MHGGCHKGMPSRREGIPGSGCRLDCLHRADVLAYREMHGTADQARSERREHEAIGYTTETREWDAAHAGAPTFKDYLIEKRAARELADRMESMT